MGVGEKQGRERKGGEWKGEKGRLELGPCSRKGRRCFFFSFFGGGRQFFKCCQTPPCSQKTMLPPSALILRNQEGNMSLNPLIFITTFFSSFLNISRSCLRCPKTSEGLSFQRLMTEIIFSFVSNRIFNNEVNTQPSSCGT